MADPMNAETLQAHGDAARRQGRWTEARRCFQAAAAAAPGSAAAYGGLAHAEAMMRRPSTAEAAARRALLLQPGDGRTLNTLGALLVQRGALADAVAVLAAALAAMPDNAHAASNLGSALKGLGRRDEAVAALRTAIALDPTLPQAHTNLGAVTGECGRIEDAVRCHERAVCLRPDYAQAHRNLLVGLLCSWERPMAERFAAQRTFERRFAPARPAGQPRHANPADPGRRLRIGYLSADLRGHVVARNLLPLIREHDRTRFEIVFYADVPEPDDVTGMFRALADRWRDIAGHGDAAVADMIRADGIDILVSLAGHLDRNRPLICAHRPAPIQVSAHDPLTSGLTTIDYLIADPVLVPRGTREPFTERVLRLPGFYLAMPLEGAPPAGSPPLLAAGVPTFGCFNSPAKLTRPVLQLWAELLRTIPGARLVLKYQDFYRSERLRGHIADTFASRGADPGRLVFHDATVPLADHLAAYAGIDIALDPFPFGGSTTTFEALWMGVPVVTLPGAPMVSRWSAAMLKACGLDGLVCRTPDAYIAACRALAADAAGLSALRADLRTRVRASPLCDGRGRARQMERLYHAMWRRWCAEARP